MTTDTNLQLGTDSVIWDLQPLYPTADSPEIQRDMFYLQKLQRTCSNHGDKELTDKINGVIQNYIKKYR